MRSGHILQAIIWLLFINCSYGQMAKPAKAEDYLEILDNSRDSLYQLIIADFEEYLAKNPDDIDARIECCKLIGDAFYDDYYDYNPLEEEYDDCINSLVADFPEAHNVLLFLLNNSWGDSTISVGNKILDMNRADPGSWSNHELGMIYEKLANAYVYNGTPAQVIESAELAQSLNDTIDLTYLLAEQFSEKGLYSKAIELLLSKIDTTDEGQTLYNKALLLFELGASEEALELFQLAQKDTSIYIDNGTIAEALISNEQYAEAREYLLRDLSQSFDRSVVLHSLFEFDYQHSPVDTIVSTYEQLVLEDFHNDTFGKYRFMMLFKAPFSGWKWNDLLKLIMFVLLIIVFLVLPYLYVLPIDFISNRFGIRNENPALQSSTWGLTDFWLICSFAFLIEVFVWIIFSYTDLLATFFSDMYLQEVNKISLNQANQAIVYFLMLFIMTLGYLKKTDYQLIRSTHWKPIKSIGLGILFAFLFRVVYFALARGGVLPGVEVSKLMSVIDYLKSINQFYHPFLAFLFAVVIVPFYEEFIFRGVFLNSIDRRIKFIAANIIQSVLFALVHDNTSLFLFYFFTGIITGYMVKKSNSLAPALSFHATNNLFAFIAIMRM